jgi:hypothetical protein
MTTKSANRRGGWILTSVLWMTIVFVATALSAVRTLAAPFGFGGKVQTAGPSTFTIGPGTSISGNLQIQNLPTSTAQVQICGSKVRRNLQVQNSGIALLIGASSSCPGNTLGGNLQVNNNSAPIGITDNMVAGNLQVNSNTAPTQVFNNIVNRNLRCQNNTSITGQTADVARLDYTIRFDRDGNQAAGTITLTTFPLPNGNPLDGEEES